MIARRSPSLTLRLTLLFALASALVLLFLGMLIGRSVEAHFAEQDEALLQGKVALIGNLLAQAVAPLPDARLKQQLDSALTGHHGLRVRIEDATGQGLYENPAGMHAGLPAHPAHAGDHPAHLQGDGEVPLRGMVATLPAAGGALLAVHVATDTRHHQQFMAAFRQTLWLYMLLATLAMGGLGWFAVRRGLLPLQRIRQETAAITAHHLDRRLPVAAIPLELSDLAASLNDMLCRLEDSFGRLSDFSSDLAHELRTPLSNLLTQTQVTLAKPRTADDYREILASNVEEFERLSRMIDDMLFLAKADHQQIIPHCERVDLAQEAAGVLAYYELLAEEKGVALTLHGAGEVRGDRLMLQRAMGNLLSNALRHTPTGGQVAVQIARQEDDGRLVLRVENTGSVIPAAHLPRLFDRFYRADGARQGAGQHCGLGLAITRSIIAAHGGEVLAHSADGRTVFSLVFPAPLRS